MNRGIHAPRMLRRATLSAALLALVSSPTSGQLPGGPRLVAAAPEMVNGALVEPSQAVRVAGLGYVILDKRARRLLVVDSKLNLLGSTGRPGSGPGEFREPVWISNDRGEVVVLDRALRRLSIWKVSKQRLMYAREVNVPFFAEAFCVLREDQVLLYGFTPKARLHVLSRAGVVMRSFAPPEPKWSKRLQEFNAAGGMACSEKRGDVLITNGASPWIEAFRISDGTRILLDSLRPFRRLNVTDGKDRLSLLSNREGHSITTPVFASEDGWLMQSWIVARQDGVEEDSVMSHRWSAKNRVWLRARGDIPRMLWWDGHYALGLAAGEEPGIALYTLEASAEPAARAGSAK